MKQSSNDKFLNKCLHHGLQNLSRRERERESIRSFTLVELLIVIAILAILAAAVVVVINPMEMLRQGRDSVRMREIGVMNRALNMFQVERSGVSLGLANRVYISIPSDDPTCANLGLPTLSSPWEYICRPTASHRNIDGTGWIPVDFATLSGGVPLTSLPVDPVNASSSSNFYAFVTDGRTWALTSLMESERHAPSSARDGGLDFARIEAGNNLSLWSRATGLVGYWSFDSPALGADGIRDLALTNHGTLQLGTGGNTTLAGAQVPGVLGGALSFDGVDDHAEIGDRPTLNFPGTQPFTIEAWVRPAVANHSGMILSRWNDWVAANYALALSGGRSLLRRGVAPWAMIGTTFLTANTWYYVVGVYDGNHKNVFVNGSPNAVPVSSGLAANANTRVLFGVWLDRNILASFFNGSIDEVRIYNRALSAAEVRAIFNATRQ